MAIETTKESMCINRLIGQISETRTIEEDSIVPDIKPDIISIIMKSGNVFVYKKEILADKVKIDGTVQTYIVYLSDDVNGNTRTLQCNIDFSETIPLRGAMPGMDLRVTTHINSIDVKILNGRKISVKTSLGFDLKLYANDNIDMISEINGTKDIQTLERTIEVNSLIGKGSTKGIAKETISLDAEDNLAEIMSADIRITNKDTKISYNKVLVKADCNTKVLYLTEDGRIKSVESVIPVMGFIDIQNVADDNVCDTNYELKNFIIKPNNEEEHSVYVEAEVEITCCVFEKKSIKYVEDVYSPIRDIDFLSKQIKTMNEKFIAKEVYSIREKISAPELNENEIYNIKLVPEILSKNILNEMIICEGKVIFNILYGNDGKVETREMTIPIQQKIEVSGIKSNSEVDVDIEIAKQEFRLMPNGVLDANADIMFRVNASSFSNISVIDEITENDSQRKDDYSLVIYFVKTGDTIWKIAKKYGSTVDEITKTNEIENPDVLQTRN